MVKNSGLVISAVFLAGCARPPAAPEGFQGIVEYDDRVVSFEVPGRVTGVPIHRGDRVKAGDVLAALDDALEKLQRAARASDVSVANADVTLLEAPPRPEDVGTLAASAAAARATEGNLRKTAERARALFDKNALPQSDLDRAEADLLRATNERVSLEQKLALVRKGNRVEDIARGKARVASAEAQVALEDEKLAKFTVKSLTAATVLDVHVEVGELANTGTPVATLADTTHPYVDVFVPQAKLDGVRIGERAEVRVDASSQALPGKVEWVSPRTEFTPRFLFSDRERPNLVVRVRVRVDDPESRLHAGVPAFVKLLP
ncbi:MAG: HlyD family secretion protein [Polyangiales bacterium]